MKCEICRSVKTVRFNKATEKYLCEKHRKQIYKYGKFTDVSCYNIRDRNEIIHKDDYSIIVLKTLKGVIVGECKMDSNLVNLISKYKWSLGSHGYATSGSGNAQILLHRLILKANEDEYVDHINRNKLDNRLCNLRVCTNQENNRNKGVCSHNTSGYTGVTFDKNRGKWVAQIVVNGKNIYLGRFLNKEDAIAKRLFAEQFYFK